MTEINTLLNQARLICVRRIRPRSLILPPKDRTLSLLKRTRMRKYFVIPLMLLALLASAACGDDSPEEVIPPTETPDQPAPDEPGGTRTLVAYCSAQGRTQAVAERIAELTGADLYRIEAAEPYAENRRTTMPVSPLRAMPAAWRTGCNGWALASRPGAEPPRVPRPQGAYPFYR